MLKKITVLLSDGSKVKVWAWCIGNLGIHKAVIDYDGTQSRHEEWIAVHIPTGMSVVSMGFDRNGIRSLARDIQSKSQWRGLDWFNDIPACELLDVIPVIAKENHFGLHSDWQQIKETAVNAIGC